MIRHIFKGFRFLIRNGRVPTIAEINRYRGIKNIIMPLPDFAQIEVTTRCNFKCFTCSRESLPKNRLNRDMTIDEFKLIVSQIPTLRHVKLQGLGEPLISRNIDKILSYAKSLNIETSTISNGSIRPDIATLKNLDVLTISFDSQDKEYFEKMRTGSKFEDIIRNIGFLTDLKKKNKIKTKIGLSAVVTHLNYKEIESIVEKAVALKVDEIGIVEVENWYIPTEDEYQESLSFILKSRKYAIEIKNKVEQLKMKYHKCINIGHLESFPRKSKCLWPFYSVYISVDGYITPCCIRMNPEVFNFGNIYETSFNDIWNSKKYQSFRDANINNKPNIVCDNCPN